MSYIYKQDFGKCFRGLPLPQNEGVVSHPLIELDEVYRKAEAFDKLIMYFEKSSMRSAPELYFYNSSDTVFEDFYKSEESE